MPNSVNPPPVQKQPLANRIASLISLGFVILALLQTNQLFGDWQAPLSEREITTATTIVTNSLDLFQQNQNSSLRFAESDDSRRSTNSDITVKSANSHPLGTQILLIELKEQKKPATPTRRLAEVFLFDYLRGVTELNTIDVEHNKIVSKQVIPSVHLPLTDAEIGYSKSMLWHNAAIKQRIKDEVTTTGLISAGASELLLSELQTRVSIWVPNSPELVGASHCSYERCALISLFTADNYNFAIEPVVNLMRGQIYTDLIK